MQLSCLTSYVRTLGRLGFCSRVSGRSSTRTWKAGLLCLVHTDIFPPVCSVRGNDSFPAIAFQTEKPKELDTVPGSNTDSLTPSVGPPIQLNSDTDYLELVSGLNPQPDCPYFRCQSQVGCSGYPHLCLTWLQIWRFSQTLQVC